MTFVVVTSMDEVFDAALLPAPEPIVADVATEPDAPVDETDDDLARTPADVAADAAPQAQV